MSEGRRSKPASAPGGHAETAPAEHNAALADRAPRLSRDEALDALNDLRSNVIGTQNASWSNAMYPLVAILNAAGFDQHDPTKEQLRQHLACYGGAGGFPGHELDEPSPGWREPTSRLQLVVEGVRRYLADPTDKNRAVMEARLPDA